MPPFEMKPKSSKNACGVEELLIYGPPKVGKSFLALTASADWPEDPFAERSETLQIKDVCYLGIDNAPLNFLRSLNIEVTTFFDVHAAMRENYSKNSPKVDKVLRALINAMVQLDWSKIRFVVHDSLSRLEKYFKLVIDNDNSIGSTQEYYKVLLGLHLQYYQSMTTLFDASSIWICHEKQLMDGIRGKDGTDAAKDQKEKLRKTRQESEVGSLAVWAPDITGQGYRVYTGESTANLVIAKDGKGVRHLYPKGTKTNVGGSKYGHLVDDIEPPNLKQFLQKVGYKYA